MTTGFASLSADLGLMAGTGAARPVGLSAVGALIVTATGAPGAGEPIAGKVLWAGGGIPTTTSFSGPGCYGYQIDSAAGTSTVVFETALAG